MMRDDEECIQCLSVAKLRNDHILPHCGNVEDLPGTIYRVHHQ